MHIGLHHKAIGLKAQGIGLFFFKHLMANFHNHIVDLPQQRLVQQGYIVIDVLVGISTWSMGVQPKVIWASNRLPIWGK